MPLAFESASHGEIAFGFFNIESDMLLLEHYFFFADEFCDIVSKIAVSGPDERFETSWRVYHIAEQEDVGDLMGAIHGTRLTGFIGETYRRFPFPRRREAFKQKPEGSETQTVFREMIEKYANQIEIPFVADPGKQEVSIGDYRFTRGSFQEMINYVWLGGLPRWKDNVWPDYVLHMKDRVEHSRHCLFEGLRLQVGWSLP